MTETTTPAPPKPLKRIGDNTMRLLALALIGTCVMGWYQVLDGGQWLIAFGQITTAMGINKALANGNKA